MISNVVRNVQEMDKEERKEGEIQGITHNCTVRQ